MRIRHVLWMILVALGAALLAAYIAMGEEGHETRRKQMVAEQIEARGVRDPAVLEAMRQVPRHRFVPGTWSFLAYSDQALPIGEGQTISQPYVVALMSEALQVKPGAKVLEIGTGSGYQAAVLARMGCKVFSIELVEPLARRARTVLAELGFGDVQLRTGDGYLGWPEVAPFDAIIVTCAPDHIPKPLVEQLAEGGRMCIPVGPQGEQSLQRIRKVSGQPRIEDLIPVAFVPLVRGR